MKKPLKFSGAEHWVLIVFNDVEIPMNLIPGFSWGLGVFYGLKISWPMNIL